MSPNTNCPISFPPPFHRTLVSLPLFPVLSTIILPYLIQSDFLLRLHYKLSHFLPSLVLSSLPNSSNFDTFSLLDCLQAVSTASLPRQLLCFLLWHYIKRRLSRKRRRKEQGFENNGKHEMKRTKKEKQEI